MTAIPDRPTLGVLGGMGPAATADFLLRLTRLTPAERDQDHVPTLVYSDPQTPDRSDAILGRGPSPLRAMARGVEFLNQAGCALIAIPCNSAHYWYDELRHLSSAPILHIADATADRVGAGLDAQTVGVMATDGTIQSQIYHARLGARGLSVLDLTEQGDRSPVMRGIRALKAGRDEAARRHLLSAGQELVGRGARALILACTDISAALPGVDSVAGTPVVDASDCLALAAIDKLAAPAQPNPSASAARAISSAGTTSVPRSRTDRSILPSRVSEDEIHTRTEL
jgi:aspartate racemase